MPPGRFWADPHILHHDGRAYVFFEEYLDRTKRGRISVLAVNPDGSTTPATVALERPYHLSYPHVFRVGDEVFMTPETMENRTVELYRCVEFPNRWELCDTLMRDVEAVDPTPIFHAGRWWLFVGMAAVPGASPWDELFLYHSTDLRSGRWQPHPMNPIVSDVRRGRPAGKLFEHNGRLYRPSQDCSKRYGYGVRLNQVTELTTSTYAEREVCFLEPLWEPRLLGVHSFSWEADITVIDTERRVPRWRG